VDALRFGRLVRVLRQRARLRQRDLAARAGVSPTYIARLEQGDAGSMRLATLRDVGAELGVRVELDARWRGGDEDRLLDAGHASLVDAVVGRLRRLGWDVVAEYSFNRYGDRGAVDVLAWHAARRALLIVEVKTKLLDLQLRTPDGSFGGVWFLPGHRL
jgi:transcriptional regulator with XRE-family HTH domain